MNVSELARILKLPPQELREKLPKLGFHIGQKAIKIDDRLASKIINQWPTLSKKLASTQSFRDRQAARIEQVPAVKKKVELPAFITVRDLAALANLPVNKVLGELMKNGIFASLNEKIDYETAAIIGADLGLEISAANEEAAQTEEQDRKLSDIIDKEDAVDLIDRPPVIVVMGHVDHGKTKLLDAIRSTNVIAGEAGGITQHIGAYQVTRKERVLTFIDTPGHEAFTAMRSRGAKIADIAILVVAADDGVKPQTIEAFRIIEAAKIPFIVAINKIDKPEANLDKTKQELSNQLNLVPEDWGGKTVCVPISAREGTGIEELLDMLLLTAEVESATIKANPKASATGTIIDSRLDKGEGPVATVLIQNGTLVIGDQLLFNGTIYGKVRALKNYRGENIGEATPSTPVKIIGLKVAPVVGDIMETGEGEKVKFRNIKSGLTKSGSTIASQVDDSNAKKINIIIKSDVLGSAEAIEESLEKIGNNEIKVKIISKGLGNIAEGDVVKADANKAMLVGFNVKASPQAEEMARGKNVSLKTYRIIYDLINDIKALMVEQLEPEIRRNDLGKLYVKAIFRTENDIQIFGGKVIEGRVEKNSFIEVERGGQLVGQGKLLELQSGKESVNIVETDEECGMKYQGDVVKENDILTFYREDKIAKKL
ncbi:translation initiation factor IF-2 [Candidatus Falkowbacteria bacterium]|nr:translation initiation factor IF-2 [Candidatus Falkowbacteria bacterium]